MTQSSDGLERALDSEPVETLVHTEAAEVLYQEHGADLEAFLAGVLRDRHQASEVVQIVFRKALEHLAKLDIGVQRAQSADQLLSEWQSPRGWLFRVGWNEAMLARRVQTRHQNLLKKAVWNRDLDRAEPADPDSGLIRHETVETVRQAIRELPDDQRVVVRSRIYEEKTFAVIAEELGLPLGTVLTRMRLAMQKLERALKRLGGSE